MTHTMTKSMVKALLRHWQNYDWTLQRLGMLRLYLSPSVRLHIWDSNYKTPNVSELHTHPWDFLSHVVCGRIINHIYVKVPIGEAYYAQQLKCGEGGGLVGRPETVHLAARYPAYVLAGDTYTESADIIHRSQPDDGTVTVVERNFREDKDHAYVLWPVGTGRWVSAEPHPASPDVVESIVNKALRLL